MINYRYFRINMNALEAEHQSSTIRISYDSGGGYGEDPNEFDVTEDSGLCVVRAGYEGTRKSQPSNAMTDYSTRMSIPMRTKSPSIISSRNSSKFNEMESIVNAMDSMKIEGENDDSDSSDNSANVVEKSDKRVMVRDLLLDFSNRSPNRFVINRGGGIIMTIMNERFVITCAHITMRSCSWFRAYFKIGDEIEAFNIVPYSRIYELDLMVMRFESAADRFGLYDPDLDISNSDPVITKLQFVPDVVRVDDFEAIRTYRNSLSMLNQYRPRPNNEENEVEPPPIKFVIKNPTNNPDNKTFEIREIGINSVQTIYSTLYTRMIDSVPIVSVPISDISGLPEIRAIEEKYQKKLEEAIDLENKRSIDYTLVNSVYRALAGLSGSLIYSKMGHNTQVVPIGMIVTFNMRIENNKLVTDVRAVPIDVMLIVVDNCIRRQINRVMGIQIAYTGCVAEEETGEEFNAAVVSDNSARYVNGRKDFWFNRSDLVLKIDLKSLERENSELIIDSEEFGRVPINAYLFYRSNTTPNSEIGVMIPKLYEESHKKINYQIRPIAYTDMFTTRIFHQKEIIWRGYVFLELSEEMIRFYSDIGIELQMFENNEEMYRTSTNGERIVLLFNYNRCLEDPSECGRLNEITYRYLTQEEYQDMPCTDRDGGRFFYQLEKVSNRTIGHLEELDRIIDQIDRAQQKKITLLLRNRVTMRATRLRI